MERDKIVEVCCYVLHCCLDTNSSTTVELRKGFSKNLPAVIHRVPMCWCVVVGIVYRKVKDQIWAMILGLDRKE